MATGLETPTARMTEARAPFVKIGTQPGDIDLKLLATALREKLRGEVRFDATSRALYATDGSNYRQTPLGVVVPRDEDDVIHTVHICRDFGAPVLNRGGATSLAGQCCNAAVVIDFTKYMHNIIELNPDEKYAWVQPGIINDSLRDPANQYGLTFGPDPATHNRCTVGGMIGNNSCGVHTDERENFGKHRGTGDHYLRRARDAGGPYHRAPTRGDCPRLRPALRNLPQIESSARQVRG